MKNRSLMSRKEFIKTAVLGLGVVITSPFLIAAGEPAPAYSFQQEIAQSSEAVLYQGTSNGKIIKSENGGVTWRVLVNFGADYAVETVSQTVDGLLCRLIYAGAPFYLFSQDERIWHTTSAPAGENRLFMPLVVR